MVDVPPTTVEIAVVDLSRTRARELIKIQQQNAESEGSWFTRTFKKKAVDADSNIFTASQLLAFYIILEVPFHQINWYVRVSRAHGGMNAFVCHTFVTLFIHFPLFILYTTMGFYSKKGYLKFWDCLPICRGLSYTCMLATLLIEINNLHLTGLTILYITDSVYGVPWTNCDFVGADEDCIPQFPDVKVPQNGCEIASHQYNQYSKRNIFRNSNRKWYEPGSIKIDWAITVWVCCIIILIRSMLGFKRNSTYMYRTLLVVLLGFAPLLMSITIMHSLLNRQKNFSIFKGYRECLHPELWAQAVLINLHSNSPGVITYLSSISPENMKTPVLTAFKVFMAKIVLSTLFTIWYTLSTDQVMTIYNIQNSTCIGEIVVDDMIQFTIFTDVLTLLPLPFIWINLHYFNICVLCMTATMFAVTATVNSLIENFPSLTKHRFRVCLGICLLLGGFTMITLTEGALAYDKTIKRGFSVVFLIVNLFAISGIVFIYGVKTLKHDILFIYGSTLTPLFWFSVTLLPLVLTLECVYILQFSIEKNEYVFENISLVLTGILCLPLILFPIYQMIKKAARKCTYSLFVPAKTWGVEKKIRKARETFNPDKEVEYNASRLKCNHYCLVNSTRYKREVFSQTMLYQSLISLMTEGKEGSNKTHLD